ncbi:hypothetical protein M3I53_32035 [Paraburkholderia sp. CNPSo 3272]|uniref:hypothetical protein n=1 Tax=Paraburkholderia sp. CNPSo 3272 TaxID=2940931 RepID=UPI0020B877A3|nr:hypothetical protein [Paraburkholderia sp. CNPSo 3272]MCP3727700.1 hypothetical protein [Paraburkholderia sp. CNPSo 3272]
MRPTVLGVFDSYANAYSAQRALSEAGIAQADIAIYSISADAPREKGPRVYLQGAVDTHHHKKVFDRLEQLFARIFTTGAYPPDAEDYREFIRRGGTVISADIAELQIDQAIETMLRMGAADIEERANAWRTGSAKAPGPEHTAHPGGAAIGERARPHEVTHGWQGDTRAASAARPMPTQAAPATAARGPATAGEKQPHTAQAHDANTAASNAQRPSGTGFMGDPGLGSQHDDQQPYDSEFRKDYDAHYANTGASYDEYRRAYSHGATLGRDERFRGADWQGVEASARANWESRYPESGWERFKTAVRHGWERVRGGG